MRWRPGLCPTHTPLGGGVYSCPELAGFGEGVRKARGGIRDGRRGERR